MTTDSQRYHSFDALRAAMMFLGVVIHTACAYSFVPDTWWYYDIHKSPVYDFVLLFIHVFRLPVFFVMAGFFAALLYQRRGPVAMFKNRTMRVLVPFLAAMVCLFPLMRFLGAVGWLLRRGRPQVLDGAARFILSGEFLDGVEPMHLWFLDLLFVLCILGLVAAPLLPALDGAFRRLMLSRWRVMFLSALTFLTLCLMPGGVLGVLDGFLPDPILLAAYGVFFFFGWLLYRQRDLVATLKQEAWWKTAAALPLAYLNYWAVAKRLPTWTGGDARLQYLTAATGAVVVWLLVFGLAGLFLRYADRPSAKMRWLSDSSYWVYLMHPPLLVVLQLALSRFAWSAHVKFGIVLLAAIPILLVSYQYLVRATFVGALLNGRRNPIRRSESCEPLPTVTAPLLRTESNPEPA